MPQLPCRTASLSLLALASALATSPAVAAVTPSPYAAESLVIEHLATVYTFAADGTGSHTITASTRIQSEAAARDGSVLAIPFAAGSETVDIRYIRVIHPDGTVVPTPPADAQVMPQPVTRAAPFYSDLKEMQVPVRSLGPGDRLEYSADIHILHPEAPGHFWGQESFVDRTVTLDQTVELHLPRNTYSKVWSPAHPPVITEVGNERVYLWKSAHLQSSLKADGSAADPPEGDPEGALPDLAWTSFHDWAEVGAWYRALAAGRSAPDDAIRARVAELTAGKPSLEEKQHALYDFVATRIRYIGVAFGTGRYQPHTAPEVLRNQYGDCKDKHTLLSSMLALLGTPPDAVLVGAGIRFNPEVPSPGAFNHLVTLLPAGTGPPSSVAGAWLDSTAEVAPWGMLLEGARDRQALVVSSTGAAVIAHTPASPPFPTFSTFEARGSLDTSGTAHAHIQWTERGDGEVMLRTLLRQVSPAQWPDLAQGLSRQLGFAGTTSHVDAARPEATAAPARISYDYEREKLGDWDNLRIVPLLPVVFVPAVDEKKPPHFPIQLGQPHVEHNRTELKLPPGWRADLPAAIHERNAYVAFDKTYTLEGESLIVDRRIEVLQRSVPPAEWQTYRKWFDTALGGGETFVQLHAPDAVAAQPAPTQNSARGASAREPAPAPAASPPAAQKQISVTAAPATAVKVP